MRVMRLTRLPERNHSAEECAKAPLVAKRPLMKTVPSKKSLTELALISFLLSIAMLSKPTLAEAADDDTTTTLSMPRADTGLREPSSGGSVVLRGTRSVSPASTHAPICAIRHACRIRAAA